MNRGRTFIPLTIFILTGLQSFAQCVPGNLGHDATTAGAYVVSWNSMMIVDKENVYTNTGSEPVDLVINDFSFHSRRTSNPITPFVVFQRGTASDFLVMAIGNTIAGGSYSLGLNVVPFSTGSTVITVPPGARVLSAFMEAYPDGSGAVGTTSVSLNVGGGPVWFNGGPSATASGSIELGKKIVNGQSTYDNLSWDYMFNINMCETTNTDYASMPAGTSFYGINTTDDLPDANPGDGICEAANGHCSLRAAIEEANASSGSDVFIFSATGALQLSTPLPDMTSPIIMDGYSAHGYAPGAPTMSVNAQGFNPFLFDGVDGVIVRGMDLSSQSVGGFDSYGLSFYSCRNVEVYDNIINNRVRAIHANGIYDITIENNDLRDCGDEAVDGALFLRHVLEEDIPGGMLVRNNLYGAVNADPKSMLQVHYCRNVIVSDGSVAGTGLEITHADQFENPIRFYQCLNMQMSNTNLSSAGSAKLGTGLRILDCDGMNIQNCTIGRRSIAVDIDGGSNITVSGNDFTDSGEGIDRGTVTLRGFSSSGPASLDVSNNTMGGTTLAPDTYISLHESDGVSIGNESGNANIKLSGVQTSYYPIGIYGGSNLSISDLDFTYSSNEYHQSKAVWMKNGTNGMTISNCTFNSWAAAVHVENATNVNFNCNLAVQNRNGILVDNASTFSALSDNNFGCNAVAIQHRGSVNISTSNNYWGDATGSSSAAGTGDFVIGSVDVSSFNASQNTCAVNITSAMCAGEICGNGIDDDLDGLTDCEDGGCADHSSCMEEASVSSDRSPESSVNNELNNVSVYPNPTIGMFVLEVSDEALSYTIMDMVGSTVDQGSLMGTNRKQFDMSAYSNGPYLIEVNFETERKVARIVKR